MKIKLVDQSVYQVVRAEITSGRLEIDFKDKPVEEIQPIFMEQGNLVNIELLTDDNETFGEVPGFTVYGGIMVLGDIRTVILTKEVDAGAERLASIEADILEAKNSTENVRNALQNTIDMLQECILEMSEKVYQ